MYYADFAGAVGNTPLVGLPKLSRGLPGRVLLKLEFMNPLGSLKDRIARRILDDEERSGRLRPGQRVIEASSGNTGISLAALCAARGYRLTVVMPDTMSLERRMLLMLLGAEIILTPGTWGLRGAVAKVRELLAEDASALYLNQGEHPANARAHEETAAEIYRDTGGAVDAIVLGVGTGGTYRGMARFFQERSPAPRLVAVEPEESAVLSGGEPCPHGIAGIGPGVVPPQIADLKLPEIATVSTSEALQMARHVIRTEGIPVGISSGAAITVALRLAAEESFRNKTIVALASSFTERYLSTELAAEERAHALALATSPLNQASLLDFEKYSKPSFFGERGEICDGSSDRTNERTATSL